jgi:hypothetical protein
MVGEFAALVRSKVKPSHTTEKAVKVVVVVSYVNDPAVGRVPDPVKAIVQVVITSAIADDTPKVAISSTGIPNCLRIGLIPPFLILRSKESEDRRQNTEARIHAPCSFF